MSNFIDRILVAYRPMYLRGLLMDGQYRLPATQGKRPAIKGDKAIELAPELEQGRRRMLVATVAAAAMSLFAKSALSPVEPTNESTSAEKSE